MKTVIKKEDFNNVPIANYIAYYMETEKPVVEKDGINLPVWIESINIPVELKDKFLITFNNVKIPTKKQIEDFLTTNK